MEFEASRTAPPESFPELPDLPAGRYTDPRFFELEKEHIWRKSWMLAAHIDEIPEKGSFMLWERAGQPVVIVNAGDGRVNAFYNTCRHRGAPVVTDQCGKRSMLTCRYHGWSYNHDGKLLSIRDPEDFKGLRMEERGLIGIRCERYGNLIFVNFDDNAPTLLEWLGPVAKEWEEFQFDKCRLAARHIFDLDCNWKIAMEANTEVYHVRSIHPSTVLPILDDRRNVNVFYPQGHGRMIAPAPRGSESKRVFRFPGAAEIPTVGEIGRTCTQSYGVFPNWVSPLSHFALPPLIFWPNGINKCRLETWTMAPDWGDNPAPDSWTVNNGESLNQVLLEDTEFGNWIQKSVESYGFKGVPISYQEARIYHWHQTADRLIGIENIPEELRVKQVIGAEWMYPNDPRLEQMEREKGVSAG
ncbi:MAG: aromatic ring-hydroxylating dioxygenase subunit alpha [Pseudomonadales bacterium]|nr:aromatic ring-hydroxylating dioxygenase subunit alpha [Pseudomonadales bacterium]MCP5184962.1 aromatic ring-hydroxylating dioxygenase subunit alpha [Pseudomonadales bacterium]